MKTDETKEPYDQLNLLTLAEYPDLQKENAYFASLWPEFMFFDRYELQLGGVTLFSQKFSSFQYYFQTSEGKIIAMASAAPCYWNGSLGDLPIGWSDMLVRAFNNYDTGIKTNTLALFETALAPECKGKGFGTQILRMISDQAKQNHFQAVIVPVRPTLKTNYQLTPMERYAYWKRPDGSPFDPWLRTHVQLGGEILGIAYPSMTIEAEVNKWEKWSGLRFPESGEYVIPHALAPVRIDLEMNIGRYLEPNIWVHHPITTKRLRLK